MKLKKLFKDIPVLQIKGSKDIEITGITSNSKVVAPGNLFIAKKGRSDDGARYIPEAIAGGAVAIVTDIYDPTLPVVQVLHQDVSSIEGRIAAEYYQHPSDSLFTVGITGTNGKTTVSFMAKHLLDDQEDPCGLIGTIEYIIGTHRYQATRTTPDVCSNQKMLREMILQGCKSAILEVTSHALDQKRTEHIEFDCTVFTNLTLDHLDYHKTMEAYAEAKRDLFRESKIKTKKSRFSRAAVVNADSSWTPFMLEGYTGNVLSYGIASPADLQAKHIVLESTKTTFTLCYKQREFPCECPLIGRHNIYNCLAAIGIGLTRNIPIETLVKRAASAPIIPGRLERVPNALNLTIYVDFAHTDDALSHVLKCLRELTQKKIITVFGCGGNRDATKRPAMGKVCGELSDVSFVTSDNPRLENPQSICEEIAKGFAKGDNFTIEVDRQRAIEQAVALASPEDIILIAGKGHETYQMFGHQTIEFDDRKVALQACEKRERACCSA